MGVKPGFAEPWHLARVNAVPVHDSTFGVRSIPLLAACIFAWVIWATADYAFAYDQSAVFVLMLTPAVIAFSSFLNFRAGLAVTALGLAIYVVTNGWAAIDSPEDRIGLVAGAMLSVAGSLAGRRVIVDARAGRRLLNRHFEREAFLVTIAEAIPYGLLVLDEGGVISEMNHGAQRQFGSAARSLVGCQVADLIADSPDTATQRAQFARMIDRPDPSLRLHTVFARGTGEAFPVEVSVGASFLDGIRVTVVLFRDLTSRLKMSREVADLQEQVSYLSKLEIAHEMVAGIAHELAQPLAAIKLYAATARKLVKAGDKMALVDKALEDIGLAVDIGNGAVVTFRDFLKQQASSLELIQPESLVRRIEALARVSYGAKLRLNIDVPEGLPLIFGNGAQFELVLLNLVRNGFEAARGSSRPRVDLSARAAPEGVEFVVRDNGPGIDPAIHDHIFDARMSTKREGLGVGLAIAKRIVEAHEGRLWAEPAKPGQGAAFHLVLPVAPEPEADLDDRKLVSA